MFLTFYTLSGFRAEGAHLPTPPPVPEPIQRALQYIASKPPQPQQPQYLNNQQQPYRG